MWFLSNHYWPAIIEGKVNMSVICKQRFFYLSVKAEAPKLKVNIYEIVKEKIRASLNDFYS